MGCASTPWAEESFGFSEKKIEMGKMLARRFGEFFAGEWVWGGGLRGDEGRGLAPCGEVSPTRDGVLEDALGHAGSGTGGSALGETAIDGGFSLRVGQEKMLDDLLDAPFSRVRG